MFLQMITAAFESNPGLSVIVTITFILLLLVLGYKLYQNSLDYKKPDKWSRIKIITYGFLGFFVWAGIILGPAIAILSGLFPAREV